MPWWAWALDVAGLPAGVALGVFGHRALALRKLGIAPVRRCRSMHPYHPEFRCRFRRGHREAHREEYGLKWHGADG